MAERPIRIGVQIQQADAEYAAIRDAALRLEELGVDIIYNWDHFFPLYDDLDGTELRVLDDAGFAGGGHQPR